MLESFDCRQKVIEKSIFRSTVHKWNKKKIPIVTTGGVPAMPVQGEFYNSLGKLEQMENKLSNQKRKKIFGEGLCKAKFQTELFCTF